MFGAKLNAKPLTVIAEYMIEGDELELTTFQQLYIEVLEIDVELVKEKLMEVGLSCYPVIEGTNVVGAITFLDFAKDAEVTLTF